MRLFQIFISFTCFGSYENEKVFNGCVNKITKNKTKQKPRAAQNCAKTSNGSSDNKVLVKIHQMELRFSKKFFLCDCLEIVPTFSNFFSRKNVLWGDGKNVRLSCKVSLQYIVWFYINVLNRMPNS